MKLKSLITVIVVVFTFSFCTASCSNNDGASPTQNTGNETTGNGNNNTSTTKMKITIGTAVFTAILYDNPSATAFKARLPLTINMTELNGNEKYYDFPSPLPTNASVGGDIKVGDLTLYGNNVLVLFYKDFNTSYSYTKLGYIDNPTGLATALGSGNATVKFENN
ncbi:cyclophilin-like fold protein [Flavobacterium polysaccharolyticum]|uniref:Cyclophilin-like fold protein n=1 Tax=Flavobacterium polysaccharolyticum TaxID=3133148 RepID=A0ABU9NS83_9FLAO